MRDSIVMAGRADAVLAAVGGTLTDTERERASRFVRERDRDDFVAAHLLVRQCAAALLGRPAEELTLIQYCDKHGPGHGRPSIAEVPELGVSLSHTAGYVCAVAGPGRVGVDAEHVPRGDVDRGLVEFTLSPAEFALIGHDKRRVIRQWVRKEALVKRGELTIDDFPLTDLSDMDGEVDPSGSSGWRGRRLLEWTAGAVIGCAVTDHPAELRRIDG
ncbi:4'-phosphopantetheinyl transferase family protein [Sphaerisporangium rhizosphaerae]|uniref:4'-phosphopantetheinyl transferase family protein n=1 Tax=Sphaerisporangium rhizosphaerae TaxID=2269375 RepID=A0ABW2P286_9ACTN